MRRILYLIGFLTIIGSCGEGSGQKEVAKEIVPEELKYQIEKYSTKYHLFGKTDKPFCSIYLTVPRVTDGLEEETHAFVRKSIAQTFFSETNGGDLLQEQFKIEAETLLAEYRELETDFSEADEGIASSFNWTYEYSLDFFEITSGYLTFRITKFENTGGAHPNMKTNYFTLDLKKRKKLKLNNTFKLDEKTALSQMILARIKKQFDNEEDFEMNIWKENVKLTDNFYFSDSSYTFYYNPYEIGPFSLGPVEVSFSAKELRDMLK